MKDIGKCWDTDLRVGMTDFSIFLVSTRALLGFSCPICLKMKLL